MEESNSKHMYKKCKVQVKLWEKDFKRKNNRVPSKYDIREAPQNIRDSYKMYYKLKTVYLEDTLQGALSDDGFDLLEISEMNSCGNDDNYDGPQLPVDIAALLKVSESREHKKDNLCDFEPTEQFKPNENAWKPDGMRKLNENTINPLNKNRALKPNLNHKLFKTTYSKRNPRKSFTLCSLDSSTTPVILKKEENSVKTLPDLETILTQKTREQQLPSGIMVNPLLSDENVKNCVKTNVDEEWLRRTTLNECEIVKVNENPQNESRKKQHFGLTNIDTLNKDSKIENTIFNKKDIDKIWKIKNKVPYNNVLERSCAESVVPDHEDKFEPMHIQKKRRTYLETNVEIPDAIQTSENSRLLDKISQKYDAKNEMELTAFEVSSEKGVSPYKHHQQNCMEQNSTDTQEKVGNDTNDDLSLNTRIIIKPKKTMVPKTKKVKKKLQLRSNYKENDVQEIEEVAPDPEILRSTLSLEKEDVSTVPRIRISDLESMDEVVQKYVNNGPNDKIVSDKMRRKHCLSSNLEIARNKLKEKIVSGKLNDNFVTINIQRKKFVRGKKSINYSKYKKQQWKNKKDALAGPNMYMGGCDGGTLKCYTCGQTGHFAQNCKISGDSLLPLTVEFNEDPSPFPTLEEANIMARDGALSAHSRNIAKLPQVANIAIYNTEQCNPNSDTGERTTENRDIMETQNSNNLEVLEKNVYVRHKIPEEFLIKAGLNTNFENECEQLKPKATLYDLNEDGTVKDVTPEVMEALHLFGHTNFRKGQDRAIMRILSGLSTLVTLSTGSGKSLCYQLPAYLYNRYKKSITLVISPLVSLMEDQVTDIPHFLRAHCLHTNQTPHQRLKIINMINNGEVDILLVSPEAVIAGERSTGFGSVLRKLPPIAFACIDEAHCVSQWSHNFRPSYLLICKVLKKNLGINTILGLTATATQLTRSSIIEHLGIADGENGVISDIPLPNNLILTVSKDENRDEALLKLLCSERFKPCQSIIVYCTRRNECERIAGFLRTSFQDQNVDVSVGKTTKRKRSNWYAEPYHAGMAASRRRKVQNAFMSNELRIVVATIAFGMGINKPDIRAIIHYNMPRNFESYVQEIGRAGRDGKISYCHLFLDAHETDQCELLGHIYANSIDRHVIRKLLQHVLVSCACGKNKNEIISKEGNNTIEYPLDKDSTNNAGVTKTRVCPGHEIGFSIQKTVESLDVPEENIATLLCYLELDKKWETSILSSAYIMAKVISYGGPKYLKSAAKECPPLAMAIAVQIKNNIFKEDSNIIEFPIIEIASAIGWNSGVVKHNLKSLEWIKINGNNKRSPISVNFYDLGFRLKVAGDFTHNEIDETLDTLYKRTVKQEQTQLMQLHYIWQSLSLVSCNTYHMCFTQEFSNTRSNELKDIIRKYFQNDYSMDFQLEVNTSPEVDESIKNNIHAIIDMYPENNFSGRNIARIFHGISSPNYPAVVWSRCKYWRAYKKTNFNYIVQLANEIIIQRRT